MIKRNKKGGLIFQFYWILNILYKHLLFLLYRSFPEFLQFEYLHSTFFLYVCWNGKHYFRKPDPYRKFHIFLTCSTAPPLLLHAFAFIQSYVFNFTRTSDIIPYPPLYMQAFFIRTAARILLFIKRDSSLLSRCIHINEALVSAAAEQKRPITLF